MSTQVTNEKVDKKYYVVLMLVHMGNSVWLVPQDNGSLAWSMKRKHGEKLTG